MSSLSSVSSGANLPGKFVKSYGGSWKEANGLVEQAKQNIGQDASDDAIMKEAYRLGARDSREIDGLYYDDNAPSMDDKAGCCF